MRLVAVVSGLTAALAWLAGLAWAVAHDGGTADVRGWLVFAVPVTFTCVAAVTTVASVLANRFLDAEVRTRRAVLGATSGCAVAWAVVLLLEAGGGAIFLVSVAAGVMLSRARSIHDVAAEMGLRIDR